MPMRASGAGLVPRFPSPPLGEEPVRDVLTEEAGLRPPPGQTMRITPLLKEGAPVAQGAPVACLREAPDVCLAAPMAGRVGRISLLPGRKLSEIVIFGGESGDVLRHTLPEPGRGAAGLRGLMQRAGFWPWLRRRPFGGMPAPAEVPAAIVVMAADTRPFAPDPRAELVGREEDFARGLDALAQLTEGPVLVCAQPGPALFEAGLGGGRVRLLRCGPRHPQGSAGIRIHEAAPAGVDAPVWDLHAGDVAALGALLATGILPMTRLVSIAGAGLRQARTVRCQAGADLRGLTQRWVTRGAHVVMSGSPLDGHEAHWLAPRHRQVTVLPRPARAPQPHWLVAALTRSARPRPVIPTAALDQAFGAVLPAAPFVRALASGDDETAMNLGVLSLLDEDVALADYVLGGEAHLGGLLRGMLARIQTEYAP